MPCKIVKQHYSVNGASSGLSSALVAAYNLFHHHHHHHLASMGHLLTCSGLTCLEVLIFFVCVFLDYVS